MCLWVSSLAFFWLYFLISIMDSNGTFLPPSNVLSTLSPFLWLNKPVAYFTLVYELNPVVYHWCMVLLLPWWERNFYRDTCTSPFGYKTFETMNIEKLKFPQEFHSRGTVTVVILARGRTCLPRKDFTKHWQLQLIYAYFLGFVSSFFYKTLTRL